MNLKRITVIVILLLLMGVSAAPVAAETGIDGANIFSVNCAGCHANGGNIVRRGKNLKKRALQRNGVDSLAAVSALVAHGKNNMPAYQDRLDEQQIEAVAAYVLEQAEMGWR